MPARRPRQALTIHDQVLPRFEGSAYSNQECLFLLEHLGEPALVALPEDEDLPEGVNSAAVIPILDTTHQLELYQESQRKRTGNEELVTWTGFDKLREILEETLKWNGTMAELRRRTKRSPDHIRAAARCPSLYLWDPDTDVPSFGGTGSDSDKVLTALGEDGHRILLHTELHDTGEGGITSLAGVAKFVRSQSAAEQADKMMGQVPEGLILNEHERNATVECPLCHHTEVYETQKPTTKRVAMTKMHTHLMSARTQKEPHRLLSIRLKSGKAGRRRQREESGVELVEA